MYNVMCIHFYNGYLDCFKHAHVNTRNENFLAITHIGRRVSVPYAHDVTYMRRTLVPDWLSTRWRFAAACESSRWPVLDRFRLPRPSLLPTYNHTDHHIQPHRSLLFTYTVAYIHVYRSLPPAYSDTDHCREYTEIRVSIGTRRYRRL